tara:strand:+ start:627 stop:755 length:129 start_codon:yes stop_codon:yes gene_type:complete
MKKNKEILILEYNSSLVGHMFEHLKKIMKPYVQKIIRMRLKD